MPVEFKLKDIDLDTWITEVKVLQNHIARHYNKVYLRELYGLYKKLIYSTRFKKDLDINSYIKDAVLDSIGPI